MHPDSVRENRMAGKSSLAGRALGQESGSRLHGIMRGVTAGKHCTAEVSDPVETVLDAADEDFASPNRSVVAVSGAVEADADDALLPFAALGQNRSNMRSVVLDASPLGRHETLRVRRRSILWMAIVHDQQIVTIDPIHRDEVVDSLLKGAKGLIVAEVANVLADKGLAVDDERDGVLEIGAESEDAIGRSPTRNASAIVLSRWRASESS